MSYETLAVAAAAGDLIRGRDREIQAIGQSAMTIAAQRDALAEQLAAAQQQIAELQYAMKVEQSHSAGLRGAYDALEAAHKDSPLFRPTGKVFPGGKGERVVSRYYTLAHDRKARELGIDPRRILDAAR